VFCGHHLDEVRTKPNILIVDDDSELLEQLSLSLRNKHYRIETAKDGEKALDKIFEIPYDLNFIGYSGKTIPPFSHP